MGGDHPGPGSPGPPPRPDLAAAALSVVQGVMTAVVAIDLDCRVLLWNAAAEDLFGWSADEVLGTVNPALLPDLVEGLRVGMAALQAGDTSQEQALRVRQNAVRRHRAGHLLELDCFASVLRLDDEIAGLVGVYAANHERLELVHGLRERVRQQAAVAELGQVALSPVDLRQMLDRAVQIVTETLRVPSAALARYEDGGLVVAASRGLPWPPGQVLPQFAGPHLPSRAWVEIGGPQRPWGALCAYAYEKGRFTDDDLLFLQSVGTLVADADARRRAEAEVQHRATHDALTGLPNRELLRERLTQALEEHVDGGPDLALLLLDLDGFKDVNDSQGHQAGDVVLRQVARRLAAGVQDGLVARLGGDEFAVVLPRVDGARAALAAAAELTQLLDRPFSSPGGPVSLGGSIGVSLAPDHGRSAGTLLMKADLAMYRAKRERLGCALFDRHIDERAGTRLWLVNDLRSAIHNGDLTVAFQPIVGLADRRATAVEALARWSHRLRGGQAPAQFVQLAEQAGLIGDLTDVVLRQAVRQGAAWYAAGRRLPVSVNLSAVLLSSRDYPRYLRSLLESEGLPPHLLQVEVTETTLASEGAVAALRWLRDLGVKVAIDDFGTGWSSLGRIKLLPVHTLKIDRTFVTQVHEDRRDAAIVRAVVALADELDLEVVAEGVETRAVADTLSAIGVLQGQGFLFAEAMPGDQVERWRTVRPRSA